MEREINFAIKKGVYCNCWCTELMKKALIHHFAVKKIKVDIIKEKVHLTATKRINPNDIIVFLKRRGYHLVEEK